MCFFFKLYFFKKFECVVNFVSMSSSFCFLWRLIFSCHRLSGLVHFFTLCMTSLFKKKEKVIVLWCVFCLFQYADFVFPELFFFFWHCTFNLKCFLYLLDIGVLPFLIGLYNFAMFYSLCFMVTVCSVRTKTWRLCPTEWRLLFLWCSPLASCLFSHDIY